MWSVGDMFTTPPVPMKPLVFSISSRTFSPLMRVRALDGLDQDVEAVIGMAAEGRNRLLGIVREVLGVADDDRLLRVVVGELVGDQQGSSRKPHAFGRVAGGVNEALRGDAVALVERHGEAELLEVARDDGWALTEARH